MFDKSVTILPVFKLINHLELMINITLSRLTQNECSCINNLAQMYSNIVDGGING